MLRLVVLPFARQVQHVQLRCGARGDQSCVTVTKGEIQTYSRMRWRLESVNGHDQARDLHGLGGKQAT